ncbi:hypothetical protein EVAR_46202_1 [Eumeta japonica]|uniref:Uncharacterized protein n=1 Tax=Eumeta variegata TaxID=151549 RepID=A0A4C1WGA5_EUMVA|nr:hypothetical protein EVAR_46202_1 [Eumeta japonica]
MCPVAGAWAIDCLLESRGYVPFVRGITSTKKPNCAKSRQRGGRRNGFSVSPRGCISIYAYYFPTPLGAATEMGLSGMFGKDLSDYES